MPDSLTQTMTQAAKNGGKHAGDGHVGDVPVGDGHAGNVNAGDTAQGLTAQKARFEAELDAYMRDFKTACAARLPSSEHPLHAAAAHHFAEPGKMLRARMAIASALLSRHLSELDTDRLMNATLDWALAVEFLHNASLVHDDLCDDDRTRRGRASVWAEFGRDTALALGDWLIAESFAAAARAGMTGECPALAGVLAGHMSRTTTGQAMEFEKTSYPDWLRYLEISSGKTAPLFIAPVEGVARLAGQDAFLHPLTLFFNAAGTCYQIANDIQNMLGTDGAHSPASDLLRRAPNAVIVQFISLLTLKEADRFRAWLDAPMENHAEASYWQGQIAQSSALSKTAGQMMKMLDTAEEWSARLPADMALVLGPIEGQLKKTCQQIFKHCG